MHMSPGPPHPRPAPAPPLPRPQVLALFSKAMRRLHGHLRAAKEAEVARTLPAAAAPAAAAAALQPTLEDLDAELDEAAQVCIVDLISDYKRRWRAKRSAMEIHRA